MAGIYIHIPFCKSRCYYCDFFSTTALGRQQELIDTLHTELTRRSLPPEGPALITLPATERIETLYFGGGTPSLVTPEALGALIRQVRALWPEAPLEEITLEANPDDLVPPYLEALRQEGINRLSIGIQSFLDRDLRWMHRRHDVRTAVEAVRAAREAGFRNLSIDLIYGLPQMSIEEWRYNLEQALALHPEHLSAYHLTIEPQTPFGRQAQRGTLHEIDPEVSRAQFVLLRELLCGAGYEHYEISNFARPGYRARHNSHYWDGTPYLGIGPSAHSYDGNRRQWNVANLSRYLELMPQGRSYETERLTPETQYNEYVMTRLRTADGLRGEDLATRFGARASRHFLRQAEKFIASGALVADSGTYRIPPEEWFISDGVVSDLFLV